MLKILLKSRLLALADQFAGQSKGKKAAQLGTWIALAVLGVLLLVCGGIGLNALFGGFCAALAAQGQTWAFFAAAGGLAFILALVLTLFYAQGVIFEAKDNELLLSMPIRPSAILASRIASVYFLNTLFSLLLLGAAGYTVSVRAGGLSALNVILLILCALLLPLLSTTLSCLLAWVVSIVTRHSRKKSLVQVLLSLGASLLFYLTIQNVNKELFKTLEESAGNIALAFRHTVYPLYAMGEAIAGCSLKYLLIFAACCAVPFAAVYWLLSKSFIRIVTARDASRRVKYEAAPLKGSSVVWSLAKKDLSRFFSSPPYMLNAGLGLLYSLGMAVVSVVSGNDLIKGVLEQGAEIANPGAYTTLISAYIMSFLAATTTLSGCSVSVEGKNLWILKSMPLRAKEILTAKFLFHLTLAVPVSLACSVLYLFSTPMATAPGIVLMFLMPLAFNGFNALFGLIMNLYRGKMDYPSVARASKSSASSLIPMLSTILLVGGSAVLYFIAISGQMDVSVYGLIVTAVIFAADTALYCFLGSPAAQKRWDTLGN